MHSELRLIATYVTISDSIQKYKSASSYEKIGHKRNTQLLSDCEVVTMILFCKMEGITQGKNMYYHIKSYLYKYFPNLGSYSTFNRRKNECAKIFSVLFAQMKTYFLKSSKEGSAWIIDSMPIVLAGGSRSFTGKIAKPLASKGYCSSKKMHYYGVKLSVLGKSQPKKIPEIEGLVISSAHMHDINVGRKLILSIKDGVCLGDKAYVCKKLKNRCKKENNLEIFTPIKKPQSRELTQEEKDFSGVVSSYRQPIESLFSWLNHHTKIQSASHVRSASGLFVHLFSCLSIAFMVKLFGARFNKLELKT